MWLSLPVLLTFMTIKQQFSTSASARLRRKGERRVGREREKKDGFIAKSVLECGTR